MRNMRKVLIFIAALLFATWIMGKFVFHTGAYIHILFISAAIFTMQAIIISPKPQADV